jgi:hypothetical protein
MLIIHSDLVLRPFVLQSFGLSLFANLYHFLLISASLIFSFNPLSAGLFSFV